MHIGYTTSPDRSPGLRVSPKKSGLISGNAASRSSAASRRASALLCSLLCMCRALFAPTLVTARPHACSLARSLAIVRPLPPTHPLNTTCLPTRSLALAFTHIPARSHGHPLSRCRSSSPTHLTPLSLTFANQSFINRAFIGLATLAIVMGVVHTVCFLSTCLFVCLPVSLFICSLACPRSFTHLIILPPACRSALLFVHPLAYCSPTHLFVMRAHDSWVGRCCCYNNAGQRTTDAYFLFPD